MKQCPQCGGRIEEVPPSKWMNAEQYAAVKPGDYFCKSCPSNNRGVMPFCYWWKHEVEASEKSACESAFRT